MSSVLLARRYVVRGRVQGVGFRNFAQRMADKLNVCGWVKNRENGDVEVYAVGKREQLAELAGHLWKGPNWSEVRGVDETEAVMQDCKGFRIRH